MREHNGERFYTAEDVNHEKVREAMAAVGRRLMAAQFPDGEPVPTTPDEVA